MKLKSIVLAGAVAASLAAPAIASADPWWDHDRDDWRRHEWYEHHHRFYAGPVFVGPRCFIEERGYRDWRGFWVHRPVRICRW